MSEPTLPLDMPRAQKPDLRPSGARRRAAAPDAAAGDLFGSVPPPAGGPDRTRRTPDRMAPARSDAAAAADDHAGLAGANAEPRSKRKSRKGAVPVAVASLADGAPVPAPHIAAAPPAEPLSEQVERAEPTAAAPPEPDEQHGTEQPPPGGAVLLSPDEVLLQKVEPRSFRPNERNDSWLYWLTDRSCADAALRDGMTVEPDAPLLLSDRRAVLPKLAALAEDPDWAPGAIAVLRLRRITVEPLLRPGPEPDSYVLAAAANVSA